MKATLYKQIKDNDTLRQGFNGLAAKVFGISFEDWHRDGYWTDKYIPYALAENDRVISNASVNIMDIVWQGGPKRYIQIGTVMTDPEYRNQGLSRRVIEEILSDWSDRCDGLYLFANNTVLDFYPKFSFISAPEYQYTLQLPLAQQRYNFTKLNMNKPGDRETLRHCYQKSNPFSALSANNNYELLMFHCITFMSGCIYYSKELDTVCIMSQEEGTLICHDIYGSPNIPLDLIISSLAPASTEQVVLGFTPKTSENGFFTRIDHIENDSTLFLLNNKENIFKGHQAMFPTLSHA